MTMRMRPMMILGLMVLFAGGCARTVLKQDIPVTTNPMGAMIYSNGQLMGATPGTVSLERNRNHILTLIKENYRQEDVIITKQYQKDRVYLKAIQSGVNSGLFFKNPVMGINSGMDSISAQEETGEAYVLSPPAVKVDLKPLSGSFSSQATAETAAPATKGEGPEPRPADPAVAPARERGELTKEVLKIGAGAALSQARPLEKKVETSSSTRRYVTPDGTRVREKTSTSVGVGINPAGLVDIIDVLFK